MNRDPDGLEQQLYTALGEIDSPDLSLDFHLRLRHRLEAENVVRQRNSRGRILSAYWLVSLLAACFIVGSIPWEERLISGPLLIASVILGLLFLVPSLLLRRLGWTEALPASLGGDRRDP